MNSTVSLQGETTHTQARLQKQTNKKHKNPKTICGYFFVFIV